MSATKGQTSQLTSDDHDDHDADDAYTDPIEHLLPRGGISLFAGSPGVGKTALLATFLRDLHAGRPVFGHQPNPIASIGLISADRSWRRGAGIWFRRAGYNIQQYSLIDDPKFNPRSLRKKFDRVAVLLGMADAHLQLQPGSLLIVDPIALFLGGNLNDYDTCACACHEFRSGLRDRDWTLLGTAHTAKLKADRRERYLRPQDQILGSTALTGYGDTLFYLAAPEETGKPYYTFLSAPHSSKLETFSLERDEQGLFVPYSGSDEGNCTRVLQLFPDDGADMPLAALKELVQAIPLSRATLFRVLEVLVERQRVQKVKHGVYRRIIVH